MGWSNICKLPWFLWESSVSCYLLCYSWLGRRLQSALFAIYFSALAEFDQNAQITILHFTYLTIRRGWRTHRKLHVDTLILIPTFKFYVFSYSGQTESLTEKQIHSLRVGWRNFFSSCAVVSGFCSGRKSASADYHFTFYLPYYLEGTDDGQKTPHGHSDFNSYVKILCVFICRTDRITDGETNTLAAGGLEEHMQITLIFARIIIFMFFTVLLLVRLPLTIGTFRGFIFLRSLNSTKTRRLPFYILPTLLFGGDRGHTVNSTWTPWF